MNYKNCVILKKINFLGIGNLSLFFIFLMQLYHFLGRQNLFFSPMCPLLCLIPGFRKGWIREQKKGCFLKFKLIQNPDQFKFNNSRIKRSKSRE